MGGSWAPRRSAAGWATLKARAPREATLLLFFVGTAFVYEFLIRPW
jgi:hypothetical protein